VKFIADVNLGKLVKWLRIFGYDTLYYRGNADRNFLRKAQEENRAVLTRRLDVTNRQFDGRLMVIHRDHVQQQLTDVIDHFGLVPRPDQLLRLCIRCNEPLSEIFREEARGIIPAYVFENYSLFKRCPRCNRIFWPGTHKENMNHFFRSRIRQDLP
jgi:hypothetical protein